MNSRKVAIPLLAGLLAAATAPAGAVDPEEVDTEYWRCRFCPFPEGPKGEVELGWGYVSDDSFKHGEYNGLDDQGGYLQAGADLTWYGEGTTRWNLLARDLGLDTRSLELWGGEQGSYELRVHHDELVQNSWNRALTPFSGSGTELLTLPAGWVRASTTAGMTGLPAGLRPVNIGTERRRTGVGATVQGPGNWHWNVDFQHEQRDGRDVVGGSFINSAAQLMEPVDYQTNTVDAGVSYRTDDWQLGLGYRASLFINDDRSLTWDNPYTALTPGTDQGRLSLPADNRFHQLRLSGSYRFTQRARFAGDVSAGRMIQDARFLPATVNSQLTVPPLPRAEPNTEVNTLTANGRLSWAPSVAGLSMSLRYRAEVRNNDTPRATYTQVITDTFVGGTATNEPFGYARHTLAGRLGYRVAPGQKLSGGIEYESYDRDYAGDPATDEYTLWGEIRGRLTPAAELSVKAARARRIASDEAPVVANGAPQNAAMTWFDVADRTQDRLRAALSIAPTESVSATLSAETKLSDYDDTVLGRTERTQGSIGLDISAVPAEQVTVYLYLAHQIDRFDQKNSQSFSAVPDWAAQVDDEFNTAGLGGEIRGIWDKLDLSADLTYAGSTGETSVTATPGFPEFRSRRRSLTVRGDYRLTEKLGLGLQVAYEDYDSRDWHIEDLEPGTAPRLLNLGVDSADYGVLVGVLSARYRF